MQALQSDLRAQIRLEDEEAGRRGRHKPPRSAQQRLQQQIARLMDPQERERIWSRIEQPRYQGCDVRGLPKVREFWRQVDVTTWTRKQLDTACELLDLPTGGRKAEMIARIQDWVYAPELVAQREEQDRLEREREEVLASGRVFVCGSNSRGELGLGDRVARRVPTEIQRFQGEHVSRVFSRLFFPTPTLVETFTGRRIVRVSCGAMHTAVISADGELFTFGCGDGGRLGLGTNRQGDVLQPERVQALEHDSVIDVVCGSWHSLCIVRPKGEPLDAHEGYVYAFGSGLHGQLGLGRQKTAALPTRLPQLFKRQARCRAIATSSYHSCALTSDGTVFTWGQNAGGCLGRPTVDGAEDSGDPDVMVSFKGYGVGPVVSVACGLRFTVLATGAWAPLERRSVFDHSQELNRHVKFQAIRTDNKT
ncbi:hypothetical protein P43SY_000222 [Pythium insidiosum]|uniref:SAP domain-containing protein n=1 Tax=Pythium insidiosum TaxID=114742 RepID=A0AAD5QA44_PYTIN|nr:hypothetical protein P43SY_000222 [Pythium insidiosum]